MAEKKIIKQQSDGTKKTVTRSTAARTTTSKKTAKVAVTEADKTKATGLRGGAIILWVLALACELVAIMNVTGKWYLPDLFPKLPDNYLLYLIIFLVLDLIFLIIGSQLWKKANHLDPCSRENKFRFFIQNQLGAIVAILCFVPFIIVIFASKNSKLNTKEKWIAAAVAIVALLIGVFSSIDYHPVSQEDVDQAISLDQAQVYVTAFGHCFHLDENCQSLHNTGELIAIEAGEETTTAAREATRQGYRLCKFCERQLEQTLNDASQGEEVEIAFIKEYSYAY